jgi:hypothetical protein
MISVTKKPLTKSQQKRRVRILPNDLPRYVHVYDNGGVVGTYRHKVKLSEFPFSKMVTEQGSYDRYTVVFTGNYTSRTSRQHWYLGMSGAPFHPQGIGQHGESEHQIDWPSGGHLGKRIKFQDLPRDCQVCALQTYLNLWNLSEEDDCYRDAIVIVDARIKAAEAVPI